MRQQKYDAKDSAVQNNAGSTQFWVGGLALVIMVSMGVVGLRRRTQSTTTRVLSHVQLSSEDSDAEKDLLSNIE